MRREAQRRLIETLVLDEEAASLRIHGDAVLRAEDFRLARTVALVRLRKSPWRWSTDARAVLLIVSTFSNNGRRVFSND